jgi:hypothetical protein
MNIVQSKTLKPHNTLVKVKQIYKNKGMIIEKLSRKKGIVSYIRVITIK